MTIFSRLDNPNTGAYSFAMNVDWVPISAGAYALGWRFDALLSAKAWREVDAFCGRDEFLRSFSKKRIARVKQFEIAKQATAVEPFFEKASDEDRAQLNSMEAVQTWLNQRFAEHGWRIPTENELEVACGPSLFWWGDHIPDGIPYGKETSFAGHRSPAESGIVVDADTYQVELVEGQLKLGDGGTALCGGYPWPIAWMSLASSWRVPKKFVNDVDVWIETMQVRPVRLMG